MNGVVHISYNPDVPKKKRACAENVHVLKTMATGRRKLSGTTHDPKVDKGLMWLVEVKFS